MCFYYPHIADEKSEVKTGKVACMSCKLGLDPGLSDYEDLL